MQIPEENYMNIEGCELDTAIYRVTQADRLIDMLRSKKITLVRPQLWDDPFDNLLLHTEFVLEGMGQVSMGFMRSFYGQCWTLEKESDAMWRIYSHCKNGVKIKGTIRKLLEAIYDSHDLSADRKYFIGKVRYLEMRQIDDIVNKLNMNYVTDRTFQFQTRMLLIKREAFKHEKEIRVIYRSDEEALEDIKTFQINPGQLVDQVVFDPRMTKDRYNCYRDKLRCLAYEGAIERSMLYEPIKFIKHLHDQ
jgi:hypothetical protein